MDKHEKRKISRRFNSFFVFGFLVLVLFNFLKPQETYSELENRYLNAFPAINLKSIANGQYMEDVESYLNDHFTARNFFVMFKSKIEYLMGRKENNGVFVCDDGYLIEKPHAYDKELVKRNTDAIKKLNDTDRYNITMSVIPPAYEILKDKLPENAYRDTILKLNEDLKNTFSDSGILYKDLTSLLSKHKDDYLYYRTDHHLTSNGSYVVYHGLADVLSYTPLVGEDFKISDVSRDFLGTTYSKALYKTKPDVILDYRPLETARFKVTFPFEDVKTDSMYFPAHLKEKDKYSYFLDGNHALTVIKSPNKNGKNLLVFKDSYAHGIVPFIANHFETVHMIDLRYYNDDIIKYLSDNDIKDVLFLYSASTFMSDETVQKVSAYAENSEYLKQRYGLVAGTKPVEDTYFDDTAFVGDSLTDGFRAYANLPNATFLCGTSMTIDGLYERTTPEGITMVDRLRQGGFKKIYIMIGINENIIEPNLNTYINKYGTLIDIAKEHNPEATIYIQSILPVSKERDQEGTHQNSVIRKYNEALLALSQKKQAYYIDVASVLTDDKGNLLEESHTDGAHLKKDYYLRWLDYIKTHAVLSDSAGRGGAFSEETIESAYDVKGIAKMISETISFHDTLGELDRRILYRTYGLDESMMANASGYAGSGATAEEIAVFEVKKLKDVSKVKRKALLYIERKKDSFESYIPKEMPKLERPFVYTDGKLVVVCIADDYAKLEGKIKEYLK